MDIAGVEGYLQIEEKGVHRHGSLQEKDCSLICTAVFSSLFELISESIVELGVFLITRKVVVINDIGKGLVYCFDSG